MPMLEHPFEANRLNTTGDFLPEGDVPALGHEITDALARDIHALRRRSQPDPSRKMHLLLSPAGYGKTHLFGRVQHEQGEKVQFIFVSAPPDPKRATANVCWQIVETLFQSAGSTFAPIRRHLAVMIAPSFLAYFEQLSDGLRSRSKAIEKSLSEDPIWVFHLIESVADLAPYHDLADSFRKRFPHLSGSVVRALILSLSHASEEARTWLRGEVDQIPEERLQALRLDGESPEPIEVLRAVCTLLQSVQVPVVLCLDQLDALFLGSMEGFQELTGHLMGWLQQVPNLMIVLGCIESSWKEIKSTAMLSAFLDRIREHRLQTLSAPHARELIVRRMRLWEDFEKGRGEGWPFDLAAAEKLTQKLPTPPRGFIDRCKLAFDDWLAKGRQGTIRLDPDSHDDTPLPELFIQEWNKLLEYIRKNLKSPVDYQDAELWEGVEQALQVALLGNYTPEGITFERMTPQALKGTKTDSRPSGELHVGIGSKRASIVVAVSKKDGGTAFSGWQKALDAAMGGNVAGAVVVWPKSQLAIGKTAKAYTDYRQKVDEGAIRPFPLDAHMDAFAHLECLRKLIVDARAGMVVLREETLTPEKCRQLLVETKLLANHPLFEKLFHNWPSLLPSPPPTPATPPLPAPAPIPAAPTPPAVKPVVPMATPTTAPAAGEGSAWAEQKMALLIDKLRSRGQPVRPLGIETGPTFVRLKVVPKDDTDFAKVKKQAENLKVLLDLSAKPVIASQAGFISIDIVRNDRQTVPLQPLLNERPAELQGACAFPLGVDVSGKTHWFNLSEHATCHLLVAGTTGSGKSELLKSMIAGLCHHLAPEVVQFLLVDPKQVTFNFPGSSPYLPQAVVHDADAAIPLLETCFQEMESRYKLLQQAGKEHIGELTGGEALPRWVVILDEFADLMLGNKATKKEMETLLKRLGAKARAAGIHLILGTQRPEASVVTPLLRANLPGRISLQVSSERESKLILDEPDAAHLLNRGDLIWKRGGSMVRLQAPFVTRTELHELLRLH